MHGDRSPSCLSLASSIQLCLSETATRMIPDYQTLMLPLLKLAEDGREHRIGDVIEPLGKKLGLSVDELAEMLPSGRQPVFNNRMHWAKTYLAQAKLLEITRRAHFRITERGRSVLRENPDKIDVRLLERFQEFNEFKQRARMSQTGGVSSSTAEAMAASESVAKLGTPDELLRSTITDIEAALSSELLDRILAAPPAFSRT
jgi:restriction system protein